MTREQFEAWVQTIDAANAEYILADSGVQSEYENYLQWIDGDSAEMSEFSKKMEKYWLQELEDDIRHYGERYLTPASVKVGDGVTIHLYADSHAGTIVEVTKFTVTIRRDKAILNPDFKPEFVSGGYGNICVNQDEQSYTYEPDENGELTTVYWSKKRNKYGRPDCVAISKGRHEFHDYMFGERR